MPALIGARGIVCVNNLRLFVIRTSENKQPSGYATELRDLPLFVVTDCQEKRVFEGVTIAEYKWNVHLRSSISQYGALGIGCLEDREMGDRFQAGLAHARLKSGVPSRCRAICVVLILGVVQADGWVHSGRRTSWRP